MTREDLTRKIGELFDTVPGNRLSAADQIPEEHIGTVMFDAPIFGFGGADDPLFEDYKKPGVIGPWHMSPCEWLSGAKTVVSLFFPISEEVRRSNRAMKRGPSKQWTYARIEGQAFIGRYMASLRDWLEENGVRACVPALDPRFQQLSGGKGIEGYGGIDGKTFGSRWSERHAAYLCGLGTFGLSKGLITKKGIAGRFASVIVDLPLTPDVRPYTGIYEYCTRCGACAARCAGGAIDPERGKDHVKCAEEVNAVSAVHAPRYGCGLCQTGVPCEAGIPKRLHEEEKTVTNYARMNAQLRALTERVPHRIANLANASALLYQTLEDLNWAGFYLMENGKLVLGPFQGKTACIEITVGCGVCGTAAAENATRRVENVHAFPGHIACDSASNSEIVVPIRKNGEVIGVLDIDSPSVGRFSPEDQKGLEEFVHILEETIFE